MITRYIRDKKGRLKGCVVRTDDDNFGYSLCHPLDRNKNSKKMARKIAIGRAMKTKPEISLKGKTGRKKDILYLIRNTNGKYRGVPHTVRPYLKELMEIDIKRGKHET